MTHRAIKWRAVLMVLCMVLASGADAARPRYARPAPKYGVNDPRYAALVIDPQTGEVFHQQNADAVRHPASLTKMMTLYLLFEKMKEGKITKNTMMRASRLAASQPQTNISIREGEMIDVDTAIKALVVRSANDIAVVVAEHIGGSVDGFARTSTNKAKALGMTRTVFKNPHGLPNAQQVTSARDMVKLGIALKRDFPDYYRYFSTRQFSRRGATYYTHNRVMTSYAGVDGIKTGFINASGFNVVSSVERGGRKLIGAVLGGTSGAWRDERMKALLTQSYQTLAARGDAVSKRYYAENLPLPRGDTQAIAAAQAPIVINLTSSAPADRGVIKQAKKEEVKTQEAIKPSPHIAAIAPADVSKDALPKDAPFQRISREDLTRREQSARSENSELGWGIQVGAFVEKYQAQNAVSAAVKLVPNVLAAHKPAIMDAGQSGGKVHRARIENLTESQARTACEALITKNAPCFIYKAKRTKL